MTHEGQGRRVWGRSALPFRGRVWGMTGPAGRTFRMLSGSAGRIRTCNRRVNSPPLYR
jgi:hypothetical protein